MAIYPYNVFYSIDLDQSVNKSRAPHTLHYMIMISIEFCVEPHAYISSYELSMAQYACMWLHVEIMNK